jgi:transcription antitermination factor NusG
MAAKMIPELNYSWYTAYTFPNLEKKVYNEFIKRNVSAYLPLHKVIRQWSDRRKELCVPLFPGYVFIHTNENRRFDLYGINGFLRFVSFQGKPAIISDEEILSIKRFENTEFEIERHLIEGDNVIITMGPFTGLKGKLFLKRGKKRFGVRLNALNQSLSLDISPSFIRKL